MSAPSSKGDRQARSMVTFKPGSLEFKQLEEELARMQSEMQVQVTIKRKEFLEQEARVYFRIYKEIEQVVAYIANSYRFEIVLRFSADEMKEDDRASVLQGVNRAVVFQRGRDITNLVLTELNRMYPPPAAVPSGSPAPTGKPVVPGPAGTGGTAVRPGPVPR